MYFFVTLSFMRKHPLAAFTSVVEPYHVWLAIVSHKTLKGFWGWQDGASVWVIRDTGSELDI